MWEELKGKKLGGFKFRRQHPYNRFVLDFYCVSEQLSIEIDGGIHNTPENIEYDAVRTKILQDNGITELRFSNEAVLNNRTKVLADILEKLKSLKLKRDSGGK
jgi:very-short-patch-repair endonuclease